MMSGRVAQARYRRVPTADQYGTELSRASLDDSSGCLFSAGVFMRWHVSMPNLCGIFSMYGHCDMRTLVSDCSICIPRNESRDPTVILNADVNSPKNELTASCRSQLAVFLSHSALRRCRGQL